MTTWFPRARSRPAIHPRGDVRGWVPVVEPGTIGEAPEVSHAVRLFTGDETIVGTVRGRGRLSDILNLRGDLHLEHVSIRREGDEPGEARCLVDHHIDSFEVELAMTARLPDEAWTRARRVHKLRYPVSIDAGRYAVEGNVHLFPGADPTALARWSGSLFIPVTGVRVLRGGRVISDPTVDAVMLNRHLVRAVEPADVDGVQDTGAMLLRRRAMALA
jgi:hypothetical protein